MPGAYVLIKTLPDADVSDLIADIPHVVSVESAYGDFDVIVKIEVPRDASLDKIISEIRKVSGVRSTQTALLIEGKRRSGTGTDHLGAPSD
jgi:DNA-binding Lrp family transcriptional regulator